MNKENASRLQLQLRLKYINVIINLVIAIWTLEYNKIRRQPLC